MLTRPWYRMFEIVFVSRAPFVDSILPAPGGVVRNVIPAGMTIAMP